MKMNRLACGVVPDFPGADGGGGCGVVDRESCKEHDGKLERGFYLLVSYRLEVILENAEGFNVHELAALFHQAKRVAAGCETGEGNQW